MKMDLTVARRATRGVRGGPSHGGGGEDLQRFLRGRTSTERAIDL